MAQSLHYSERHLAFDPDVPEADRRLIDELSEDYDRRTRDATEALADKVEEVINRGKYQARELLGAENWLALRRRMRDERIHFRELLQPPGGLTADYDELNAARMKNVQKFLRDLGVGSEGLREIYKKVHAGVRELLPVTEAQPGHAAWLHPDQLKPLTAGPNEQLDPRSAFVTFRAPFGGFQKGFGPFQTGAFRVTRTHHLDTAAGLVGHDLRLDNGDASDFDNGWANVDTQVAFLFFAPHAGVVEVFIEARCGRGLHQLTTEDEFGTSDSSTTQQNFLMMHVLHPNVAGPSFARMSRFDWKTDVTQFVQREFLAQGGIFTGRLFSDGPVPGNQFVEIRAGTRSSDGSITNDVEIHSLSVFRWFLQAVHVRVV